MDKETKKTIKSFIAKLRKKYDLNKVVLFGSRAREDNMKRSDYDVIIVSKDFEGKNVVDRMSKIYDFWDNAEDLEPLCYTPAEYAKFRKKMPLLKMAEKEGEVIA